MYRFLLLAVLVATLAGVGPASAKGKAGCPPGLAKKSVPCVPPGQAKKGAYYRIGDLYGDGRYVILSDDERHRYHLPRLGSGQVYYRDGRIVYRVDRETRRILDLIELADILLSD